MLSLSLKFLGAFNVALAQQPVSRFRSANVQGLLAYLALQAERPFPRDVLAALFWPETTDAIARQNLRQSLYQLRKVLNPNGQERPYLHVTRQTVQFNSDSQHSLDVRQFLDALDRGDLETAVSRYTGDLLPGFTCDSLEFEEWLRQERERLHGLALKVMADLTARQLRNGRVAAAQATARRQLELETWSESAHRQLIEALALAGDRGGALAQFDRCREILQAEMGLSPEPETVALVERIQNNDLRPANPDLIAGRYALGPEIGRGAMGVVHRGRDSRTGATVAIKKLKAEAIAENLGLIARFQQEAEALRRLNHPNIVELLAVDEKNGRHFLVMAFIPGGDLRQRLQKDGALPLAQALTIALDLADALTRAHRLDILHRDLKPANVLLDENGLPRLTDFGTARLGRESLLTEQGTIVGTYAYLSPEACLGKTLDERADIWSFGVLLYEMLAGERPFNAPTPTAGTVADIAHILNDPLPDIRQARPDIPNALADLLDRMLTKERDGRIPSVRLVGAELEAMLYEALTPETKRSPQPFAAPRVDWGEIPHLDVFHGRQEEQNSLTNWLIGDRCRVVTILGMGGQGKTSLAAQVVRALAAEASPGAFTCIIWRSLLNAPPLTDLLQMWLPFLSDRAVTKLPSGLDAQLTLLLDWLRRQRCLLILDNVESILQSGRKGEQAGAYRPSYADYGQLIQRVGHGDHQSCLLLTSRERPSEITRLEWNTHLVRSLQLTGLDDATGQAILQAQGLIVKADLAQMLVRRYSGNPLALKLIVETVQDFYAGDITAFLDEGTPIFDDIQDVLDQQFVRLGELEQSILFWLAIERRTVSLQTLQTVMWNPAPRRLLLAALRSLQRRSLLEKEEAGFTLQNVVSEYVTDRLIEIISQEIAANTPQFLASHALLNAQIEAHIRHSQARLILHPIAARLTARWRSLDQAAHTRALLNHLRAQSRFARSYAAGNLLNLLLQTGITDIRGHDFSHLSVWQAHLRGMEAKDVNFAHADLTDAAFTDTFGFINQIAYSADGKLLAAGTGDREVMLWQTHNNQSYGLLRGHESFVEAIAFSPLDYTLASGGTDGALRLWDAQNGECLRTLPGHTRGIYGLAFSPDGLIVASASEDQTVRLWQVSDGACLQAL